MYLTPSSLHTDSSLAIPIWPKGIPAWHVLSPMWHRQRMLQLHVTKSLQQCNRLADCINLLQGCNNMRRRAVAAAGRNASVPAKASINCGRKGSTGLSTCERASWPRMLCDSLSHSRLQTGSKNTICSPSWQLAFGRSGT
jgi:hypothetical protein